jgi:L1 cell adhesion molecule like protein
MCFEQVPLGVLLYNQTNHDDMISIIKHIQQYVPCSLHEEEVIHQILLGGDQLSTAMTRRVQAQRRNSTTPIQRLQGVIPVCEDWHTKLCLLTAIWKILYNTKSVSDKGTLFQIRNLLNRRNVSKSPKENFDACDDLFNTALDGHIIAAALSYLNMTNISDTPSIQVTDSSTEYRGDLLHQICSGIVSRFVQLKFEKSTSEADGVYGYACKLLSLGLFYREFTDSIREGEGTRCLRCWRYLLLVFKATGRKNYSIEAFNMLAQYHFIFSPRQSHQLLWSRFVNVHGLPGRNIPCDLYMEHLNRLCKMALNHLGANKSDKAIKRTGLIIGVLETVLSNYDAVTGVSETSGQHKKASIDKDIKLILEELHTRTKVFEFTSNRCHSHFKNQTINVIGNIDQKALRKWMATQMNYLINGF